MRGPRVASRTGWRMVCGVVTGPFERETDCSSRRPSPHLPVCVSGRASTPLQQPVCASGEVGAPVPGEARAALGGWRSWVLSRACKAQSVRLGISAVDFRESLLEKRLKEYVFERILRNLRFRFQSKHVGSFMSLSLPLLSDYYLPGRAGRQTSSRKMGLESAGNFQRWDC